MPPPSHRSIKTGSSPTLPSELTRLNLATVFLGLVILGIFFYSFNIIARSKNQFHQAFSVMTLLDDMDSSLKDQNIAIQEYLLSAGNDGSWKPIRALSDDFLKSARTLLQRSDDESLTKNLKSLIDRFEGAYVGILQEFENKAREASGARTFYSGKYLTARNDLADLVSVIKTEALKNADSYSKKQDRYFTFAGRIVSTILLVGIAVLVLLSRRSMKKLISSFNDIGGRLNESAMAVSSTSLELLTVARSLSETVARQSSSVTRTSSSVEEMSEMITQSKENAFQTLNMASSSQVFARKGSDAVNSMRSVIQEMSGSNEDILKGLDKNKVEIFQFVKMVTEIGEKTKVINDIVFQTKLLSFNASVEASRAGVQGRGFAIVAEEVGKLAQISGEAAREITAALGDSARKVDHIVRETRAGIDLLLGAGRQKLDKSGQAAENCAEVLSELLTNSQGTHQMVEDITRAMAEQAQSVTRIKGAMQNLDQVSVENGKTAGRAEAAAQHLSAEAERLQSQMKRLLHLVGGEGKPAAPELRPRLLRRAS